MLLFKKVYVSKVFRRLHPSKNFVARWWKCETFSSPSWRSPNHLKGQMKRPKYPVDIYPLVNQHSNGISPFLIGNTSSKGPFSIAMLVYRSVNEEAKISCRHLYISHMLHGTGIFTYIYINICHSWIGKYSGRMGHLALVHWNTQTHGWSSYPPPNVPPPNK